MIFFLKNKYLILVFFVFAIASCVFFTKSSTFKLIDNSASSINLLDADKSLLANLNFYTNKAEAISSKIDSFFISNSRKKDEVANLNIILLKRKKIILDILSNGYSTDNLVGLSSSVVKNTSDVNLIEKKLLINGNINTFYVDEFEKGKLSYKYKINSDLSKKTYNLIPTNFLSGDVSGKILISGISFGPDFYALVDTKKILKTNTELTQSNTHKTLVLLVNFLDSVEVPFSKEQAKDLIFKGQFHKFMKEQSFNKANFEGDVYGWLTLNKSSFGGHCSKDEMQADIDSFVLSNNIDIRNYNHLVYVLNCAEGHANGYSSIGPIGLYLGGILGFLSESVIFLSLDSALDDSYKTDSSITLPFSWTNLDFLLSHELGHAIGLPHASGLDCGSTQVDLPCTHQEYGNRFDVMGDGFADSFHVNAFYKKKLGWLKESDILQIKQSGVYQLSPVEAISFGNLGVLSKKIGLITPLGQSAPVYSLEYRSAIGFDSQLTQGLKTGLYINKINSGASQLIDLQPTDLSWGDDNKNSKLSKEEPFIDTDSGLSIELLEPINNKQSFKVNMTPVVCVLNPPFVQINNILPQDIFPGQNWYSLPINNTDTSSCPSSYFKVEVTPNPILETSYPYVPNYGILANTQFLSYLLIQPKPNTPSGVYPIEIKAINTTSGISSVGIFNLSF